MWKVATDRGDFALKQVGRELPDTTAITTALAIELRACEGGVSAPRPLPSIHDNCYELIGDSPVRGHEWGRGISQVQ